MERQKKLSPSLMCLDYLKFGETLRTFEDEGIEYLHVDIMDGSFVGNFTLGTDFCKTLRRTTPVPLDLHLMIERPEEKLGWFDIQPGEYVSVHAEATVHLQKTLSAIRAAGGKPMAALNPATPLCALDYVIDDLDGVLIMTVNPGFAGQKLIPATLEKIRACREYLDAHGRPDAEIEVDGNVSFENAKKMAAMGADLFVGGTSSIFSKNGTLKDNIRLLRDAVRV